MKLLAFILPISLLLASCAELNQFIPSQLLGAKPATGSQTQENNLNSGAAAEPEPKTPEERYDRRINQARQQCALRDAGCNKGCIGVGAVGIFSALLGNTAGATASQEQMDQCTKRCESSKSNCDESVEAIEREKTQVLAGGSGVNNGAAGGMSNMQGAGASANSSGTGAGSGGRAPATCASTQQESFRKFDREMAAFNTRFVNRGPAPGTGGGSRDQYQYAYFYGTNGLQILESYRACLSNADFQANTNALVGMRDQGKKGCEQLSTSASSCTPTYPW